MDPQTSSRIKDAVQKVADFIKNAGRFDVGTCSYGSIQRNNPNVLESCHVISGFLDDEIDNGRLLASIRQVPASNV